MNWNNFNAGWAKNIAPEKSFRPVPAVVSANIYTFGKCGYAELLFLRRKIP